MTPLSVALVDDHLLFREGLRAMLASAPDLRIVAEASNAQEAIPAVRASEPEVVVLDVMLPGVSGIGIARELLRENPKRRLLALSMVADEAHVADALQAGVLGYACKSQSAAEAVSSSSCWRLATPRWCTTVFTRGTATPCTHRRSSSRPISWTRPR